MAEGIAPRLPVLVGVLMVLGTMPTLGEKAPKRVPPTVEMVYERSIGRRGGGAGSFHEPGGAAVDPLGNLFVADTGNDRIQKFDRRGQYASEIGGFGWEPGQFNQPTDVAAGRGGLEIYVADSRNSRIQAFSPHLRLLGIVGGRDADGSIPLGELVGLAVSESGELLVTDRDTDQLVQISNFDLEDRSFGGFGYGAGKLRRPGGIAVGPGGTLYVADTENSRVSVFDRFGNYTGELGGSILTEPEGVCVGPFGQVYVADTGQNQVVVFDPVTRGVSGRYGGPEAGAGEGGFRGPKDVTPWRRSANAQGIYVVDTGNHRVVKLRVDVRDARRGD